MKLDAVTPMKTSDSLGFRRWQSRLCQWRPLRCFGRRLLEDDRGATAVYVVLGLTVMIAAMGTGLDAGRAYIVKSRLSSALDAAALAGGLTMFDATRDDDIRKYFRVNFPDGFMGATITGPSITVDEGNETVFLRATANVSTAVMQVMGYDSITVVAETEVTRKMKALDLVLSMDISGSMSETAPGSHQSRLAAAQAAAKDLIKILYGGADTKDLLKIGLVPWNAKVNVMVEGQAYVHGNRRSEAVAAFTNPENGQNQTVVWYANNSPVPLLFEPPPGWKGCVFNRYKNSDGDTNDADTHEGPTTVNGVSWPGWAPSYPGTYPAAGDPLSLLLGGEPVNNWYNNWDIRGRCGLAPSGSDCVACPSVGITPLQSSRGAITSAVETLTAGGNTNIPAGLAWAWEVLTPAAPFSEAVANPTYDRDQAIVLLTDGINCPNYGDGYKRVFGSCNSNSARDKMDARLRKLAANIKEQGILVYAIQFVDSDADQIALMKDIATAPEAPFYYYAPTGDALKSAFREIANHLSELRLSK